jgi:AcrR family transcriptional regulator
MATNRRTGSQTRRPVAPPKRPPAATRKPPAAPAGASAPRAPHSAAAVPLGTRERVLQVAHEMIRRRGDAAISLVEVAAEAELSRQTLYLLFGSRAGLLMALVDRLDETSAGPAKLAAIRQQRDRSLEAYVRAWFEYLPVVLPLARALSAAATAGDEDARTAWQSRLRKLRDGFALMARDLRAAGELRSGWTIETAADWMLALTHVDLWQHLVVEAGWSPADHVNRIVAALRRTLEDR